MEHNCSQSTAQFPFCPWAIGLSRTASLCNTSHCQHINMLILQPFFNVSVSGHGCVGGQVSGIMICVSVGGFMCAPCVRLESEDRFCRTAAKSGNKICKKKKKKRKRPSKYTHFHRLMTRSDRWGNITVQKLQDRQHLKANSKTFYKATKRLQVCVLCMFVCCIFKR